jgi:ABC-2 type transport system permease protein
MFDQLLSHTKLAINPYMPSAWLIRSTLAWSEQLPRQGAFYFLLLASNAAMGLVVGFELVGRCFYGSWAATFASRAAYFQRRSLARRTAHRRHSLLERIVGVARPFSPAAAALALKDIRLFWRDPTQWIQFMIFFGLLCIYVLNLRNIALSFQNAFWVALIAHFNLAACGLTLSTLTTRFVFPQFSLEGRRVWILGLSPFGLQRLLWQKFALSAFVSVTITGVMIVASSLMLKLPAARIGYYLAAVVLMCVALCGLSVGLGAVFPNFKEENPSKIVSGFGGTLCLVLSFIYLILFLALTAVPAIIHVHPWPFVYAKTLGVVAAVLLSAAALVLPMQLAWRRVKRLEI